jgi:hypothetical protein
MPPPKGGKRRRQKKEKLGGGHMKALVWLLKIKRPSLLITTILRKGYKDGRYFKNTLGPTVHYRRSDARLDRAGRMPYIC